MKIENRMVVDSEWRAEKPILQCECCNSGIYEDESYYDVNGDIVCEDCLKDYMRFYRRVANG